MPVTARRFCSTLLAIALAVLSHVSSGYAQAQSASPWQVILLQRCILLQPPQRSTAVRMSLMSDEALSRLTDTMRFGEFTSLKICAEQIREAACRSEHIDTAIGIAQYYYNIPDFSQRTQACAAAGATIGMIAGLVTGQGLGDCTRSAIKGAGIGALGICPLIYGVYGGSVTCEVRRATIAGVADRIAWPTAGFDLRIAFQAAVARALSSGAITEDESILINSEVEARDTLLRALPG